MNLPINPRGNNQLTSYFRYRKSSSNRSKILHSIKKSTQHDGPQFNLQSGAEYRSLLLRGYHCIFHRNQDFNQRCSYSTNDNGTLTIKFQEIIGFYKNKKTHHAILAGDIESGYYLSITTD